MQKWQHCKLQGNLVTYLGAVGVFENKKDLRLTPRSAFSKLEDEGWELITALPDTAPEHEGDFVYFFRRPVIEK